jgi:hypothetical protein
VTARTVFFRNIEAVEAEDERNGLGELKTVLGQEVFHRLIPESLRLLLPYSSLELIGIVAPPDGMDDNADHGIDHGDQQLPVILKNPPGFMQYLAPLRLRHVVQAREHDHGVEMVILERQPRSITHHIRPRPWPDIHSDRRAMSQPVASRELVRTTPNIEQQAAAAPQRDCYSFLINRSEAERSGAFRRQESEERKAQTVFDLLPVCQERPFQYVATGQLLAMVRSSIDWLRQLLQGHVPNDLRNLLFDPIKRQMDAENEIEGDDEANIYN